MRELKLDRTDREIRDQLAKAESVAYDGLHSHYPAMTYEHGVVDAIRWLLGQEDDSPMGDES